MYESVSAKTAPAGMGEAYQEGYRQGQFDEGMARDFQDRKGEKL
jgi:hypothetical protein